MTRGFPRGATHVSKQQTMPLSLVTLSDLIGNLPIFVSHMSIPSDSSRLSHSEHHSMQTAALSEKTKGNQLFLLLRPVTCRSVIDVGPSSHAVPSLPIVPGALSRLRCAEIIVGSYCLLRPPCRK